MNIAEVYHWCTFCRGINVHNCQFNSNIPRYKIYYAHNTSETQFDTLSNHNQKYSYESQHDRVKAGVLCDNCNEEMIYDNPGQLLLSYPPKKSVMCLKCGYRGFKING